MIIIPCLIELQRSLKSIFSVTAYLLKINAITNDFNSRQHSLSLFAVLLGLSSGSNSSLFAVLLGAYLVPNSSCAVFTSKSTDIAKLTARALTAYKLTSL